MFSSMQIAKGRDFFLVHENAASRSTRCDGFPRQHMLLFYAQFFVRLEFLFLFFLSSLQQILLINHVANPLETIGCF